MVSALNVAICFIKFDIKAIFRYMFGFFWRLNKMKSQQAVVSETAEGLKISGGGKRTIICLMQRAFREELHIHGLLLTASIRLPKWPFFDHF
jgi:hypothetical protein